MPRSYSAARSGRRSTRTAGTSRSAASGTAAKRTTRHRKRRRINPFTMMFLVIAVIVLFFVGRWIGSYYTHNLIRGITINGIDVGGMTVENAKNKVLLQYNDTVQDITMEVYYEGASWQADANQMKLSTNIDEILQQAAQKGRTGSFFERRREAKTIQKEGYDYRLTVLADDASIKTFLEGVKKELDLEPADATVQYDPNANPEYVFTPEHNGRNMNVETTAEKIEQAISDGTNFSVQIDVEILYPKLTKTLLEQSTERRSYFETSLEGSSDARINNVKTAIKNFNGMVIMPGEEVSFNNTVGERTAENGYMEAPSIGRDKGLEDTFGGGVCQASTTLYNAVLTAGLEITERHRHSFPSTYIRTGFDAMVYWGYTDLRFKNNTEAPIYLKAGVYKDHVYVYVYGQSLGEGVTIDREGVIEYEGQVPEPKVITDTTGEYVKYKDQTYLAVRSRAGIRVHCYRLWMKNGEVTNREDLYVDEYPQIVGTKYVGAKDR